MEHYTSLPMDSSKNIALATLTEFVTDLCQSYQPFEGGSTLRKPYPTDDRYLGDNDICFSNEFESISTLRYQIRQLSSIIEIKDFRSLPPIIEELFETATELNIELVVEQEIVENAANILLYNEDLILYEPPKIELLELPRIISVVNDKLMVLLAREPSHLYNLSPRAFEEVIAEIFARQGFEVHLTKQSRDGGKDIIALYNKLGIHTKYIIECKRYTNKPVGIELVQRLAGVRHALSANKAILATTSRFTSPAMEFAKQEVNLWSLDLKDYDDIVNWLKMPPAR